MTGPVLYWDLSEPARAALTRDEVARFVDAELMLKGVLAPTPLVLVEESTPKLPGHPVYRIVLGSYDSLEVAFASEADARSFLKLSPARVRSDWALGSENVFLESPEGATIQCVSLPTKTEVETAKVALKEARAAKEENEKRRRIHAEQTKATEDALSGLWEDWHSCCAKATSMARVAETFAKYTGLANGDLTVASKFLRMAFTVAEISAAEEWTGTKMDHPAAEIVAAEDVAAPS